MLIDAFAKVAAERSRTASRNGRARPATLEREVEGERRGGQIDPSRALARMLKGDAKWGSLFGSEAFILPSHQENFGIAVAEALACGRPVLLADKVNIAEEIADDGAGLMELDTPEGTLRLLQRWIAMSVQERQQMAERAYQCFHRRYDMSENAKAIIRLFENASDRIPVSLTRPRDAETMAKEDPLQRGGAHTSGDRGRPLSAPGVFAGRPGCGGWCGTSAGRCCIGCRRGRFMAGGRCCCASSVRRLGPNCHFYPGSKVWAPWNLICADQVTAGDGVEIYNPAPVTLGSHAILSQGAYLCGATHDYDDPGLSAAGLRHADWRLCLGMCARLGCAGRAGRRGRCAWAWVRWRRAIWRHGRSTPVLLP